MNPAIRQRALSSPTPAQTSRWRIALDSEKEYGKDK
jgi:hypothetical protein